MKKMSLKLKEHYISNIRKKKRKYNKKNKKRKNVNKNITAVKEHFLLKILKEKKFYSKKLENKDIFFEVPEVFSFSKNPEETITKLKELTYILENSFIGNIININYNKCKYLGLSASGVMDAIITEYRDYKYLQFQGTMSEDNNVNIILKHSGIIKHLNATVNGEILESLSKIEVLPWLKNADHTKSATEVYNYFSKCLAKQGFTFKKEGEAYLLDMISEVVQNCSYHGGKFAQWYILGHTNEMDDGQEEMQISIFNFGNTIYESYYQEESSEDMKKRLEDVYNQYYKKNKEKPNKEIICTLYSLQDKVSRFWVKNNNMEDQRYSNTRGSGMMTLIRNLYAIGDSNKNENNPIMSITSGKVNIVFDKYNNKNMTFNKENSITSPPDKNNVKYMKNSFPGTIISMKFYLDKKYIGGLINGKKQ